MLRKNLKRFLPTKILAKKALRTKKNNKLRSVRRENITKSRSDQGLPNYQASRPNALKIDLPRTILSQIGPQNVKLHAFEQQFRNTLSLRRHQTILIFISNSVL